MAEPAHILFAIPELGSGGPDRVFHELIGGLDRSRFRPSLLVTRPGGRYFDMLPADIETCVIGGGRYPAWRFARAIDRLRPDFVVTTLRMNPTAAVARFLQRHRPPLIARQANAIDISFAELRKKSRLKYGLAEWCTKRLLRIPEVLIAQSHDMGVELARQAKARQRIVVIGNPVDLDDVAAASAAQRVQAKPVRAGDPALVAVGRLAPQKGFDLLLPAFTALRRDYPNATLTIFGEGPDRAEMERAALRLGIAQALRLPGQSDTVLAEVGAADLFVSSSRYEGFSNAILEAMALGKPVVATSCEGGTRDMVIDGTTGILANPSDPVALTEALRRALRSDLSALGAAGQAHVASRFSRSRIMGEYAALFEETLVNGAGRQELSGAGGADTRPTRKVGHSDPS
ncbi:glycosyltransferase [Roseovarius amoyensis]|uniref:glycosyltransferase n=1 Tax=Roseovarius amoyensis TaxID=2211448 RepID=UPI000DBE8D66|nr:glycosyltransferase [Roseovarius amoyensis]